MTEIEKQILTALVDLLKNGGQYALIGIVVWFLFQLSKIALIGGFTWAIIKNISNSIMNYCVLRVFNKRVTIDILSKSGAKHLKDTLTEFQTNCEKSVKDLVEHVKGLEEKSKKETKKTASQNT